MSLVALISWRWWQFSVGGAGPILDDRQAIFAQA